MMNLKVLSLLGVIMSLSACTFFPTKIDETFKGVPFINFDGTTEDKNLYWCSNGYRNQSNMFLSYWNRNNVVVNNGNGELSLYDDLSKGKNYGAELRSSSGYCYGYYGARMKIFKRIGTVQSLFTYNGGDYAHDEIDIEFLGKDTTIVQFNYYHNGVGGHEHIHYLGFDASIDFHDYGFKWDVDKITWFVDNKPVYQVKASLPQWGFIYANVWAGNPDDQTATKWLGKYETNENKYTCLYDYISYAPLEN